ncbi:lectizyme [Anastrepha ludens]|uniref:lectizyme n=1 Tax=Anastrepha ludens TaxID=28586 RepID=UPI0023AE77CA|nr:lectizyme [Anastrepha ludens]
MLISCKCLFLILFIIIITIIMVLSTNVPLPARKAQLAGVNQRASMEFIENSIRMEKTKAWTPKLLAKHEAIPHSAPYIVSIQRMTPDNGLVHYCAGTIINEHWILTAAHCLTSEEAVENSLIVAGCHDLHGSNEGDCVQVRTIDHHVRHELYLGGINPYDIALIYTKRPLQFTQYVQPAQLPEQDVLPEGSGTLYGWGNISMTLVPNYPHRLQEAEMPILDMELCERILAGSGLPLHETNLCTGPLNGGVSICTADSGGPLMQPCCDGFEERYTVIGIVSWGKMPCGQQNAPSVFVRVSAFTNWIRDNISSATPYE